MKRRRGATMVEVGFVIVGLLLLTLGLLQMGLIYNAALSLNNLAREGARFASVRAMDTMKNSASADAARIELRSQVCAYLQDRARGTTISPAQLTTSDVSVDWVTLASGQPLRVSIHYDLKQNKGFIPQLLPLPARYANYQAIASNLIE